MGGLGPLGPLVYASALLNDLYLVKPAGTLVLFKSRCLR